MAQVAENSYFTKSSDRDDSFKTFLWNPATKQFLGRTATSWLKIGVFYVIFYACLAGFLAVMMAVFYQTLDTTHLPKYTPGDGGSLLRNPAMGFRPLPRAKNVESTLIWYKNGNMDDIKHWTDSLDEFIKTKEHTGDSTPTGQVINCTDTKLPKENEVCNFEDTWLKDNCRSTKLWGYNNSSPCIILKLNKMIKWEPDVYEKEEELPDKMPEGLRNNIIEQAKQNGGVPPPIIWVSCEGEGAADKEYIGEIKYFPWQGFPSYYFPYKRIANYLPPIVAVEFVSPMRNVLINVECKAWAKNINHDRQNRLGLVHFELLQD